MPANSQAVTEIPSDTAYILEAGDLHQFGFIVILVVYLPKYSLHFYLKDKISCIRKHSDIHTHTLILIGKTSKIQCYLPKVPL